MGAQVPQQGPGVDAGAVQVVELDAHRVAAHGLDPEDADVASARHHLRQWQ